ncbi:MAG: hypothetical protein M1365_15505 [Actinobacteria bacterium]|nr:hypothetical protein [Actinomycetota bacterium]
MDGIYFALFVLSFLFLIIGLISPSVFTKVFQLPFNITRQVVFIFFTSTMVIFFVLLASTLDTTKTSYNNSYKKTQTNAPSQPSKNGLMKQNSPDIKHLKTFTSDYVGKSFVLYANAKTGSYYNYGFDDENSYYSLELWDNSVSSYDSVYAYINKTPENKVLAEKILNNSGFFKFNVSIPTGKYRQGSNAFLQIDSWEGGE